MVTKRSNYRVTIMPAAFTWLENGPSQKEKILTQCHLILCFQLDKTSPEKKRQANIRSPRIWVCAFVWFYSLPYKMTAHSVALTTMHRPINKFRTEITLFSHSATVCTKLLRTNIKLHFYDQKKTSKTNETNATIAIQMNASYLFRMRANESVLI